MKSSRWKKLGSRICCAAIAMAMVMSNVPMFAHAQETDGSDIAENEMIDQQIEDISDYDEIISNEEDSEEVEEISEEDSSVENEDENSEEVSEEDEESEEEIFSEEETESEERLNAETSGVLELDGVEWYVEINENRPSTRTLTIRPVEGKTDVTMINRASYPWELYIDSITRVVIEDGIKNIPSFCFADFRRLEKIEMADSIEEIGYRAFYNCADLGYDVPESEQEIVFPKNLKKIGFFAFEGCRSINEYVFPDGLETIERGAFWRNNVLTYMSIPASVSQIGEAFYTGETPLYREKIVFEVDEANPYYSVIDDILYENATGTVLACGKMDSISKTITLKPGTKRIGARSFEGLRFPNHYFDIVMPDSVISVGEYAFYNSNLRNVKVSDNLKTMEIRSFASCKFMKEFELPDSVTEFGDYVFENSNIYHPSFPKNMKKIPKGMYAFSQVSKLYIPYGVEVIGADAFYHSNSMASLRWVSIPSTVKEIEPEAFDENNIEFLYYGGTQEEWKKLINSQVDISWLRIANVSYYTDLLDLTFEDGVITESGLLKSDVEFGSIGFKQHFVAKNVKISDWVNKYGTSMTSTDKVAQNNEYYAYVSVYTDSFFNNGTMVTVNGEECEVFDISADGKRISFITPTFVSECKHSRVDFDVYEADGEKHWHECPDCNERIRESAHAWGPDVIEGGVTTTTCTKCGFDVAKSNGRMRMNKTQLKGGYYEVGEIIPAEFAMDESYAYSSCYELSEPKWYKGAYKESNRIDAKQGQYFQNDTYYVEFEIAIKENLADQYYLKTGGITVRFEHSVMSELTTYRTVTDDPDVQGRQIQKVVFSYKPTDRRDLTVVLPPMQGKLTVAKLKESIKFMSAGQVVAPMTQPGVTDKKGNRLEDTAEIVPYVSYVIHPLIDVPGYVDEKSITGIGIVDCKGGVYNYRPEENKTAVVAQIEIYYSPKGIVVANVDVEAPIAGEELGTAAVARENDLFEVKSVRWFTGNGVVADADDIARMGWEYGVSVILAPKGQNIFTGATIFTVNGYDPTEKYVGENGTMQIQYLFPPIEEHIHTISLVPMDPGNCSRTGHVAYYQCSECGRSYLDKDMTKRITNISEWLTNYNNDIYGGMIQDTSIHNFVFDQENNTIVDKCQDCGVKNINYRELKVHVADVKYTGNIIDAPITIEGLSYGADFYFSEGGDAILPGVYKAVIEGRNTYGGKREVEWKISTDGLWIAFDNNDAEYDYSGQQIKPSVKVYDGERCLTAGKDYSISYKNNVNAYMFKAGEPGFVATKAPTVVVTGKGDYTGKETANFVINPKAIDSVKVDDIYVNATGKPITIKPVVKIGKKTLALNKDYRIYSTTNMYDPVTTVTDKGNYELVVVGIGNYTGNSLFHFDVSDKTLINKCSITVKNAEYDKGRIVKPDVTVKYQGKTLSMGTDYDLELADRAVGNASVKIIGKNTYTGVISKNFKITGIPVSSLKVDMSSNYEYNGGYVTPFVKLTYEKNGETPITLVRDRDYSLKFLNHDKAGKAKIVVTGMGGYTGTKNISFKIAPYDVEKVGSRVTVSNSIINQLYLAGGVKPDPDINFNGTALVKGVDYTCSYSNNNKVALADENNPPTVTITFKGNFKGKITKTFNIRKMSMNSANLSISVPDIAFNSKANGWVSKPVIKDSNGKLLVAGRDYTVSYYNDLSYSTLASDNDNVINKMIHVKIEGKNNYVNTAYANYRILRADIAKAQVKINNIEYDPEGLATVRKSDVNKISINGIDLQNTDYAIVAIKMPKDNKLGTGTVLLQGLGEYFGKKKVTFKVVPRNTSDDNTNKVNVISNYTSVYYTKSGTKIHASVRYVNYHTVTLREGVDYKVSYSNINKAGSKTDAKAPTMTITFKGNYKGKQTVKYDITKQYLGLGDIYNSDVIYNNNPDGWKQTKFTFKDIEKKVLKAGVDYKLVPGYYKDSACTQPFTDAQNRVGEDVYFKLAAIETSNYQGEYIGCYKIVSGDISKAKITVKNTKSWTGTNVDLLPSDIDVSLNGTSLAEGSEWEIVVCRNNVNRGTATVEIRGVGNYGGTKTATFKIVQKPFIWWNR